jgi:hypothetical protein
MHPNSQRKGAAITPVPWNVKRANELCIPAYLESSDVGYELYAKLGFKKVDVVKTVIDGELCGRVSGYVERSFNYLRMASPRSHNG